MVTEYVTVYDKIQAGIDDPEDQSFIGWKMYGFLRNRYQLRGPDEGCRHRWEIEEIYRLRDQDRNNFTSTVKGRCSLCEMETTERV